MMKKRLLALTMIGIMITSAACGAADTASAAGRGSVAGKSGSSSSKSVNVADEAIAVNTTSADGDSADINLTGRTYSLTYPEYKDNYDYREAGEDATLITMSGSAVNISGNGAEVNGTTITISQKGDYILSGSLDDGQIIVDSGEEAVHLFLDGVTLNNDDGPAIYVVSAKNVYISLEEGSVNSLSDGKDYKLEEGEDEPDAVIFSKADLIINGSGSLNIDANYACGIRSKDDLVLRSGSFDIESVSDALKGKDLLAVYDGTYIISSGGKGLASTNSEEEGKGIVYVENGTFKIRSGDDAIHSNTNIMILGGEFDIDSNDDGIHAEEVCLVYDSDVEISGSYEGIEGSIVDLVASNISITAEDDGINAAGDTGEEDTAQGNFGRGGFMDSNENNVIYIDGGSIYVNAKGDGIDSNGYLYIYGGDTVVDGPENDGNGFLDYGIECTMTGGTLIAAGSAGMLQSIGESSGVYAVVAGTGSQKAGTEATVSDADGNEVVSYTPSKSFSAVLFAGFDFEKGEEYTASAGGSEVGSVKISAASNTIGEISSFGGPGGFRGNGGERSGFNPGDGQITPPGGFNSGDGQMTPPDGFDPSQMPEDFDKDQMPEGFTPGGDFTPPEGFDPSGMPEDFRNGDGNGRNGKRGGRGSSQEGNL